MGGLGNQMFQYAAARAVAQRNNVPIKLDISWYESQELRSYRLDHFNISADIAASEEIASVKGESFVGIQAKLFRWSQKFLPYYKRRVIKEQSLQFDPNIRKVPFNAYLIGNWQSEKYFADISKVIHEEFRVKDKPDLQNQEVEEIIHDTQSVSVHIRRGDYVSNLLVKQIHGTCDPEYYKKGIELIVNRVADPHLFIFSDDPQWAIENLTYDHPTTFVSHNDPSRDYEDLRLMSMCKYHITANSSFSWWGAWLASKAIITVNPKKWFTDGNEEKNKDRWPPDWISI